MATKYKPTVKSYPARELTEDTRWIVCMWDVRGDAPEETAMILKRSLKQIKDIIAECKANGYYDKVKRCIEEYDIKCSMQKEKTVSTVTFRLPVTCLTAETN